MIAQRHRFHGHASLRYVYSHGRSIRGPLTSIKFVRNQRRDSYRMAVVISKKIAKSAVKRNRMRRRLYETVRRLEPDITGPYDIVVTVFQPQLETVPAPELEAMVTKQLHEAGIIKQQ